MSVGEFCNRAVVVANAATDVATIARLMREHHVGDVVVVDDTDPARVVPQGILTDRDIVLELVATGVALERVTAGDVMSADLVTAGEQDSLWQTLNRMRSFGVRRMVVVNGAGGLEGILTLDDVIELLADELAALAKIPLHGREREKSRRG
ncbi:MAG: CBS domain-containing protein [Thermodesulfobacteriota bacterium]|jgi:CBS domain-containing protein